MGQNRFKENWKAERRWGLTTRNSSWVCQWTRWDGSCLHAGTVGLCVCGGGGGGGVERMDEQASGLRSIGTLSPHRLPASYWKWPFPFPSPYFLFQFYITLLDGFSALHPSSSSSPSLSALSAHGYSFQWYIYLFLPPPPPPRHTQDLRWLLQEQILLKHGWGSSVIGTTSASVRTQPNTPAESLRSLVGSASAHAQPLTGWDWHHLVCVSKCLSDPVLKYPPQPAHPGRG